MITTQGARDPIVDLPCTNPSSDTTLDSLVGAIKNSPHVWREFVRGYVFGGDIGLKRIGDLTKAPCKHIILSRGNAKEVCDALLAVQLQGAFDCVVDTHGRMFWPRDTHEPSIAQTVAAFDNKDARKAAFIGKTVRRGSKDVFIDQWIRADWEQVLPQRPGGRVIYIDDNPEDTEHKDGSVLPAEVEVYKLDSEQHGILFGGQEIAVLRKLVGSLTPQDVVVWDFDCTLSCTHLYKTLKMDTDNSWSTKWGQRLLSWC